MSADTMEETRVELTEEPQDEEKKLHAICAICHPDLVHMQPGSSTGGGIPAMCGYITQGPIADDFMFIVYEKCQACIDSKDAHMDGHW